MLSGQPVQHQRQKAWDANVGSNALACTSRGKALNPCESSFPHLCKMRTIVLTPWVVENLPWASSSA